MDFRRRLNSKNQTKSTTQTQMPQILGSSRINMTSSTVWYLHRGLAVRIGWGNKLNLVLKGYDTLGFQEF